MFQERYNRIVLPFFFFSELFILTGIYLFTLSAFLESVIQDLLVINLIWALPSLFFKSYRVPRTYSFVEALYPQAKTITVFTVFYFGLIFAGFLSFRSLNDIIQLLIAAIIAQSIYSLLRYEFFHRYRLRGNNIHFVVLITPQEENNIENLKKDLLHFGYHIIEIINDISDINDSTLSDWKKHLKGVETYSPQNIIYIEKSRL